MTYRIGIDVGGTNTDAVLIDENMTIISKYKVPTSKDIMAGIKDSIAFIMKDSAVDKDLVTHAMLGTTQCTNAIVERRNLNKVGVIRIGYPATTAIPPLYDWPEDLLEEIGDHKYTVSGGYEYNGDEIVPINTDEIKETVKKMKGKVDSIAVTGVHSPVRQDQEKTAYDIIKDVWPDVSVSLSNEIGSMGLLERENGTVLNSALQTVIKMIVHGFEDALHANDLNPDFFLGQNDGTLMKPAYALDYPIFTIGCGPTNSIRGAVRLSGLENSMIIDVGGTTMDIGIVQNGFPRESSMPVEIGGVRTNFRMPDILSIGLGGGTIIRQSGEGQTPNDFRIGPDSVGHRLTEEGIVFGGETLTATDVAIGAGVAKLEGVNEKLLNPDKCQKAHQKIMQLVEEAVDRMKTNYGDIPAVLTGGGSILLTETIHGTSQVIKPDHFEVANALGAAISDVSGEIEKVYSLDRQTHQDVIENAKQLAIEIAIERSADPDTIKIVSVEDVPLAYMPGNILLVKVKAVGDLNI